MSDTMQEKHFVTFYSPGTMVAETTTREIPAWDLDKAVDMAREVKERYGATPYGFRFTTRRRDEGDFDSHAAEESGLYWLGGEVLSLEALRTKNSPQDRILIQNMECNGWSHVVSNNNSWQWTQPLMPGDTVLPVTFKATE